MVLSFRRSYFFYECRLYRVHEEHGSPQETQTMQTKAVHLMPLNRFGCGPQAWEWFGQASCVGCRQELKK